MNLPTYESILAACKIGCFCCGDELDPGRARAVSGKTGSYIITCKACGEPKTFEVRAQRKPEKPKRQT
jgi:RNase P subunit RPR2